MGAGSFRVDTITLPDGTQSQVGIFTIVAVADYSFEGLVDEFQWPIKFNDLNEGIFQASLGKIVIEVFLSDDSWGLGQAEFILHQNSTSPAYATFGKFGRFGEAVHLFSWVESRRHTMVHEFGHHVWGLGDEYTAPLLSDSINTASPSPGNDIIPINNPQNDPADVIGSKAVLKFGDNIERRDVMDYDVNTGVVTVNSSFSEDPTEAEGATVWFQRAAECSENTTDRFCIMDSFPGVGGTPKFDFCISGPENHDPDGDTLHTARYPGESCWDVMERVMDERWDFYLPAPDALNTVAYLPPEIVPSPLVKEARVVLAMDRSGSMGTSGKIQGARYGVEYWLRSLAKSNEDWLALVWYNENVHPQLELDQYSDSQTEDAIEVMNDQVPSGWTNIRDALWRARDEIQSRDDRAAIQAVVLLTDGIHNRPLGTVAQEVIPTFQAEGIQIVCVGLGGPDHIDYGTLEDLAEETGGTVIRVDGGGTEEIENGLADAEAVLRHGKVQEGDLNLAPLPKEVLALGQKRQPPIEKLVEKMGFDSIEEMVKTPPLGVAVIPFYAEAGAQTAKFSTFYRSNQNLWLYLIDPHGNPVDYESAQSTLIRPTAPFTSAQVKGPKDGRWKAVITGAEGIHPVKVLYLGMVVNRRVVVSGGCRRHIENAGDAVAFWATATFWDRLSGLRVQAKITAPSGAQHLIQLSDNDPLDPGSGDYRGMFIADHPGSYRYTIQISGSKNIQSAGGMHRLSHANPKKRDKVSLETKTPAFTRVISGYFDVGKRPAPKDIDELKGSKRWPVKPRKNKLTRLELKSPDTKTKM